MFFDVGTLELLRTSSAASPVADEVAATGFGALCPGVTVRSRALRGRTGA